MSIFSSEETPEHDISVAILRRGKLFMLVDGRTYDLAPPQVMSMSMPVNTIGVDEVLEHGCRMKRIDGDFELCVDFSWNPKCDALLVLKNKLMDGWIYSMHSELLKFPETDVWVCGYIKLAIKEPPKSMYLTLI